MGFQAASLTLMAVFYACYFGKMLAQKRQGIQTDQLGKGKTGFARTIELSLKCITYIMPFAELYCIFCKISAFSMPVRILGAVIAAAGDALFIAAVLTMADSWRAGVSENEKTELVTRGVFRISRNPAFLGFEMLYVGILLMFFCWPLFWLTIAAELLFHLQIVNVEEDYLIVTFGDAYVQYCRQVCRYFGRKRS